MLKVWKLFVYFMFSKSGCFLLYVLVSGADSTKLIPFLRLFGFNMAKNLNSLYMSLQNEQKCKSHL